MFGYRERCIFICLALRGIFIKSDIYLSYVILQLTFVIARISVTTKPFLYIYIFFFFLSIIFSILPQTNEFGVVVDWSDGHISKYSGLWLHDHTLMSPPRSLNRMLHAV